MPVRNCLKPVLEKKLQIKNLTAYRFQKLTGLGRGTSIRINDPNWVPNEQSLATICKTFRIQPGEFLYWVPDESDSIAIEASTFAIKGSTLVEV
jgi:DNA-binding Xre family transcriptional regulator